MNVPQHSTPQLPDSTFAAGDSRAAAMGVGLPGRTDSEVADFEGWLGYESIHPLTWVPDAPPVNGAQVVE